jgi:Cu(I)/Ag(I) efflux system membrane fusion protein
MSRIRNAVWMSGLASAAVVVAMVWTVVAHRSRATPTGVTGATAAKEMAAMPGMAKTTSRSVRLTPDQIRQFGVTFGTADERPLDATVRTTGTVIADETTLVQVVPKFGGFVEHLYVDFTGQAVRRGQPLLTIYSPELVAAQQELLVAGRVDRSLGDSQVPGLAAGDGSLVAATRQRLALWDISDAQIDEVLRTGRVRHALTLYAPVTGTVLEKHVVQGQAIQAGETLLTLANLGHIWIDIGLRERDAGAVRVGSAAEAQLTAFPGRLFHGHVAYVYPTLDSATRSIRARIAVPNPVGLLKPGMYATVRLTTPLRQALSVPTSAVMNTGDRTLVFIDMGSGALVPHAVVPGRVAGDYTEIISGVEPGQRVVTSAQFLLDSESNLAEVMKGMIGQMNMSDMQHTNDTRKAKDMPGMNMSDTGASMKGTNMEGTTPKRTPAPPPSTPR